MTVKSIHLIYTLENFKKLKMINVKSQIDKSLLKAFINFYDNLFDINN